MSGRVQVPDWYRSASAEQRRAYDAACKQARTDLLTFAKLMMPDYAKRERGDLLATQYRTSAWHRFFAGLLQRYADWPPPERDLCVSVPPQHGKTQLASIFFLAWYLGRYPQRNIIFATYNTEMAEGIGRAVKGLMYEDEGVPRWEYRRIFPYMSLRSDSKSARRMITTAGGRVIFVGVGGTGTGNPADLIVVDDPIKNADEARSAASMQKLWEWYNAVVESRGHRWTRKVIIHTRWVIDDLIGRLCDPSHPEYNEELAKHYEYINIPAILDDQRIADALGLPLGSPLWPERFPLEVLERKRLQSPSAFSALYMGRPTHGRDMPFSAEVLTPYERAADIPSGCEVWIGVDLAIGEKHSSDPTAVVAAAWHRETDTLFVLPTVIWERLRPEVAIERIVDMCRRLRPRAICAERDLIWQTVGPVLRRRLLEERLVVPMVALSPVGDKERKASALAAMCGLGRVMFPAFASWWPQAFNELTSFPLGAHDDFVDALANVARGLDAMGLGRREIGEVIEAKPAEDDGPRMLVLDERPSRGRGPRSDMLRVNDRW